MPAVFQKTVEQDLHKPLKIQYCADTVFTKDNAGNQINVLLYKDGEPYNGGGTVSATAIRADGATESWAGTISGNTVSVALTRAALDVPGTLQVFIKVTAGTVETTVYAGVYNVVCTETPTVVAPVTPSDVAALIASIEAAIRNIPADWTSFLGTIAPTFDPAKADGYAAGDYVWYPGQTDNVGTLYRFTSAHSGTWTGTDAVTVVIGNELNDTVRYTAQVHTDEQKTIARANIGAASADQLSSLGYQVSVNTTDIDVIQRTIGSGLDPNNTVKSQLDGIKADIGTVPDGQNLQDEVADLKSAITDQNVPIAMVSDHYINLTTDPVDIDNPSPSSTGLAYAVINCEEGDQFIINAVGAVSGRAWGFLDSNNSVTDMAEENATISNLELTIPAGVTKLVINDKAGLTSYIVPKKLIVRVNTLEHVVDNIKPDLSEEAKQALLACFRSVAWTVEDAETLYKDLENALYNGKVDKLTVEFIPGYRTIFTDDPLDSIKYNLSVLFNEEVINKNNYTLEGVLVEGQSVLTVSYGGRKTNVVIPTVSPKWEISIENSNLTLFKGAANMYALDSSGYGCASLSLSNTRRTFYIDYGRYPYRQDNVGVLENAYPITVPVAAKKVIVTLSPSTYYASMFCSKYTPQNITWQPLLTLLPDKTITASPVTFDLPESDGKTMRTLSFSIARNSSGSAYSDGQDPTAVTIRFE